ncbi:MAG: hypothetical protein IT427_08305 [Pirellulales bacterium]|nr:hypothetical protein [Pirellulales bacterium]
MRTLCTSTVAIATWAAILGCGVAVATPFESLVHKVPEGANVLVLVNVEQILNSPFARSHDSKQNLADAFAARAILIPPDATQFVLAAQFDLEHFTRLWEAAVMELKHQPNFEQAAKSTGRTVEKLGGLEAIGGAKLLGLNFGEKQVGFLVPSNRQLAARWAQRVRQNDRPLSNYLAQTSTYSDTAGTDIILAVDLTDVVPRKFIADHLRENEVLKGKTVDFDKLAAILARALGVRLGIKIGAQGNAMLVVDLQDDPAPFGDDAKPLLLSILEKYGLMIEEMSTWKPALGKNTISISGTLTDEGLQRIMGVVELPANPAAMIEQKTAASPEPTAKSSESLRREASKKYFKAIEQALDSLRMQKKDAKSLGQIALWINNAARRIDRMSTLNVDEDLLNFSTDLTNDLRNMVAALQGAGIRSGAREASYWSSDSYYYDDGYDNSDVQSARRQVRAEEQAVGATNALELSRSISNKSAAIRRKMTQRYQVAF